MRAKGTVAVWNDEKGFGFIESSRGNGRLFAHISEFRQRGPRPRVGHHVTFDVATDAEGRPCAAVIRITGLSALRWQHLTLGFVSVILVTAFLSAVYYSVAVGKLPAALVTGYLVMSLVTFLAYALDKSAAKRGHWRTPESTLHGLSILCGWPGALLARHLLRHKTMKQPFRFIFWLTVLLNTGLLGWLLFPDGQIFVHDYLAPFLRWFKEDFGSRFSPLLTWLKYDVLR